tara:strand:- start:809 stop:1711 length:903 start_codon:yes stop_codon:yes gene_type:complete
MIYKFIDINGSEIAVNSLSSLQALVDSETIKENTKVKAGLRGKWTTASEIEELSFVQEIEEEKSETTAPEVDIKTFITAEKKTGEVVDEKPVEATTEPWQTKKQDTQVDNAGKIAETVPEKVEVIKQDIPSEETVVEKIEEPSEKTEIEELKDEDKSDYELDAEKEEEKRDKKYDDENVIGLSFSESISTCLKKYFNFKDRASRSEYWYFQLVLTPIYIWSQFPSNDTQILVIQLILTFGSLIPGISAGVRRLHDRDKSGWFMLISFIPILGAIFLIVMLAEKGTPGKNKFGEYPLKLKK